MVRFFTYCWQHREMLRYPDGAAVRFAYGSQFARRGIRPGDHVYIVSVHRGGVFLLSKIVVGIVTDSAHVFRHAVGQDPEPAAEYLIAESYTPARLVRLSDQVSRALRFVRSNEPVPLVFRGEKVDPQSLRSVRQMNAQSAAAIDELLPALATQRPGEQTKHDQRTLWPPELAEDSAILSKLGSLCPKTVVQVRMPKHIRVLAGKVHGVSIVVRLHKPGKYRHENSHIAHALRSLAGAIERAGAPLADQDGELSFGP